MLLRLLRALAPLCESHPGPRLLVSRRPRPGILERRKSSPQPRPPTGPQVGSQAGGGASGGATGEGTGGTAEGVALGKLMRYMLTSLPTRKRSPESSDVGRGDSG